MTFERLLLCDIIYCQLYISHHHTFHFDVKNKTSPVNRLAPPTNLQQLERAYKFVKRIKILENPIQYSGRENVSLFELTLGHFCNYC